jgi:UDP-glucose 4-epimerase
MVEIEGKKVLVTGGAGFIGSWLVRRYLAEGASEVVVYDNFSTGRRDFLAGVDATQIEGDILDSAGLASAMRGCDIVSHHAAELEVFNGIENTLHELAVNVEGTVRVLNAAINAKVEKVVYASSGGVYGQAAYVPEDESHPILPHWPYGVSKLAGEKYCQQYTQLYGLPTVSFRYGIVFGPHEWYGRVLTMFLKRTLEGKPLVIFGDGGQRRDFVFVQDVVDANILGTLSDEVDGMAFNVGGVSKVTVTELAQIVAQATGSQQGIVYEDPAPGEVSALQPERRRLPGELRDFILSSALIEEKLGYVPATSLEQGVPAEWDWIRAHPECWDYAPRV